MLKVLKTFYHFVLKKRFVSIIFFITIIITPVAEAILPYFYKLFVDAIPELNFRKLLTLLILYIGFNLLGRLSSALAYFIGDCLVVDASVEARTTIFEQVHKLDFAFHTTKSSGSLISIFKRGDNAFWDLHHSIHYRIIAVIIHFIVMMAFFANLDLRIFGLTVASLFLALLITKIFISVNYSARLRSNEEEDKITGVIVDNMVNFETVKMFARENWEKLRLLKKFKNWKKALWKFVLTFRFLDISMAVIMAVGVFASLVLSLKLTITKEFSPGDFILVIGFTAAFYPKLFDFVWGLRGIVKNYSDIQKYFGILDRQIQVKDPEEPVKPGKIIGEVEYKNVSFSYEDNEKNALRNVSLKIRAGQSIALVGRSGAGKTTMAKLLMRFFDVKRGQVTVDDIDVKNFTKSDLRSLMGIVPQEPILFNHTIGYNIAYGRPGVNEKEIQAAAKMAHIHDFIMTLTKKYQTQVGERGIKLSGGQKQRVAIARMILSNPKIVIFDEATSQLDSESEKLIQDAFWKAVKNRTTVIIAHRLSTVMRADKIVVMENGRIVETGSHQALIKKKKGLYKYFWELQSLDQEDF